MRPVFRLGILHCTAALLILSQGYTQPILLHHQFTPGQTAQSHTAIKMQGNTLIGGEDAKTNLSIQMLKHLRVGMVDPSGEAELSLILDRIKTQGTMNNENFNQDLTGDALKSVMFGMTKEDLTISPQGAVRGHNDLSSLSQLGISLPSSPSNHGGFEFPTFPSEPVQLGSEWTESGMLIRERRVGFNEGTGVYKLLRITSSPFGRAAVIQYKKTTDLSGMDLGNMASSGPGIQGISTGSAIQGLVISLEGEIVFLIDHGLVWKTTQEGYWNLQMGSQSPQYKKTTVDQRGMKIHIQSVYTWNRAASPTSQRQTQTQAGTMPPLTLPPSILSPKKDIP